jgi:hypothetical protein
MKNRKKSLAVAIEKRNALYNKTILHNRELAEKNTELSHTIDYWKALCIKYEKKLNAPKWWQFWRHIYQMSWVINPTEVEVFDVPERILTTTYFYNIPIWKQIINTNL